MFVVTADTTLEQLSWEFQKTAIFPPERAKEYLRLGLISEVGEACNVWKKVIRDDRGVLQYEKAERLISEFGDVLWYVVMGLAEHEWDGLDPDSAVGDLASHNAVPHDPFECLPGAAADFNELPARLQVLRHLCDALAFFISPACPVTDAVVRSNFSLPFIAQGVITRLSSRAARGVLSGSGDDR